MTMPVESFASKAFPQSSASRMYWIGELPRTPAAWFLANSSGMSAHEMPVLACQKDPYIPARACIPPRALARALQAAG